MLPRLLILDDDELFCDAIKDEVGGETVQVTAVHTVAAARALSLSERFDVVLLDNNLPDGSGLELLPDILEFNDRAKIILITAFPSFESAVAALKAGAHDYLSKPIDLDELRVTIERAVRAAKLEGVEQVEQYKSNLDFAANVLIGEGTAFDELRDLVRRAATTNASVLITGETGTGKNVVAKAIHFADGARSKPFIQVNCAALPENLIESELFGVERGAFTGATTTRKGTFELADGGTLFLDEIAEMPVALQAKLLGVLEDGKVRRLGGDVTRTVNSRIIAATNVNPEVGVNGNCFRRDLYYRLSVIRIHLQPLRERREEIPNLCRHFLNGFAPGRNLRLPDNEISALVAYDFPGNVRELKNIIERCIILQEGSTLFPSQLISTKQDTVSNNGAPLTLDRTVSGSSAALLATTTAAAIAVAPPFSFAKPVTNGEVLPLAEVERRYILAVLTAQSNNLTRTADKLAISLTTLKRKLREYGVR